MKSKRLLTPRFLITVGDYMMSEGITVECVSSKASGSDWCKLMLPAQLKGVIKFDNLAPATVELGYDDDYNSLIYGYASLTNADYWKEILIRDDMIYLEREKVRATFIDCTPQDVIKYVLSLADITDFMLDETVYSKKKVFSVDAKNGIQVLKEVNAAWNIDNAFFFQERVFYWGRKQDQEVMYVLEEQNNILSVNKYGELWEVETLGIPWIHHSQQIEVIHSKYTGIVEVYKTIIKSDESGFVRMFIYFQEG